MIARCWLHGLDTLCRAGVLASLLISATPARADSLETIPLRHRMAEELLPMLQPLLPQGAVITGTGNVLFVRAGPATLQQVREAVATLDRAPRQLLITVGQATNTNGGSSSVRGSGTLGSGDVQVGINRPPQAEPGGQVVVRSGTHDSQLRSVASVRALEGYETYIAIGESHPFTSTVVSGGGYHPPVVSRATGYRDVQTGFYVTPRISGDRVALELSSQQQRFSGGDRSTQVTTGSVTTTVTGRLGDWIEIGGTTESANGSSSGLVSWGTRSDLTQYSAWVKVDEAP